MFLMQPNQVFLMQPNQVPNHSPTQYRLWFLMQPNQVFLIQPNQHVQSKCSFNCVFLLAQSIVLYVKSTMLNWAKVVVFMIIMTYRQRKFTACSFTVCNFFSQHEKNSGDYYPILCFHENVPTFCCGLFKLHTVLTG